MPFLLLLAACNGVGEGPAVEEVGATSEATPTIQPDDLVNLTVYFRQGSGSGAHLVPVTREVSVTDDLARTALEHLLAGPEEADGSGLAAPLPVSTTLQDLVVDGGVATVDLSADVIRAAGEVGASPENEVLALAALANTLTEFPAVERVRVLVEGRDSGWRSGVDVDRFWGGWGLPPDLARDESVIGPPREGEGVPDLEQFTAENQQAGAADADPVQVASIRTRERTTYLRLVVELADGSDPEVSAAVPAVSARPRGGVTLQISDVVRVDDAGVGGDDIDLGQYGFEALEVDDGDVPGTVTVTLRSDGEHLFRLHSLTSPTRVVLDVKK